MKLAIADPPYPPIFRQRFDLVDGGGRLTSRSRATRWYGDHPDAADYDNLTVHRNLLLHLVDNYDGWAIATTPDGLQAYFPLPVNARIMSWVRPRAMPGGERLMSKWEPVIVQVPEGRRGRGLQVSDVLIADADAKGFIGSKPAAWCRWVTDVLGYDAGTDTLDDLFPGSGGVTQAVDGLLPLPIVDMNPATALHLAGTGGRSLCGHAGGKITDSRKWADCSACLTVTVEQLIQEGTR